MIVRAIQIGDGHTEAGMCCVQTVNHFVGDASAESINVDISVNGQNLTDTAFKQDALVVVLTVAGQAKNRDFSPFCFSV